MVGQGIDKFRNFLKSRGLKMTPERRIILEGVFSLHEHFDIEKLYRKLEKKRKNISRATIYRTIPFLIESGLIKEVMRHQNKAQYEQVFGHEHHDHLVCVKCGRVIEFRNDKIEKLQDEICKRFRFSPEEHRLRISGYCQKCK